MPPPAKPRSNLRRNVLIGFAIASGMLAIIATVSIYSTRAFIGTGMVVTKAHEAIELQERILRDVMGMESSRRGFLITGDERFLRGHAEARKEAAQSLDSLGLLARGFPAQSARVAAARELLDRSFVLQREEIAVRRKAGAGPSTALFAQRKSEALTESLRALLLDAEAEQRALLGQRAGVAERIGRATSVAVTTSGALTILALVAASVMLLRDLAARRRAEEALAQEHNLLSSIINALPVSVYVKDVKGRYILNNNAHRLFLGLEDLDSIEGRTSFDYFSPESAIRSDADDRDVVASGSPILNREEPIARRRLGDRETWLETNKVPLLDTDGKIVGLVGISADISLRKEAEEQLKHFATQLERSNAELQSFASVASHDLQEPLRKIQAFGDRLKARCSDQLGPDGIDYLDRMQSAAERMRVLIQDLLKLSRITSRGQPFEACDLGAISRDVLNDLELAIEQTQARIEIGPLPAIEADPVQMRQLFQNLIANALKFHKPGAPPEIGVSGRVFELREHLIPGATPGDPVCQIHFQDAGIGFDAEFAEQIFVVFQRLHSREQYEGTGIGLAVCRKITDRHGGGIVAKSEPGQGALFIVTLPVHQPSTTANE